MKHERAWPWLAPAIGVIALVAVFPLAWTAWESLHRHDLRMPWLGRPFVGLENYAELAADARFWGAMAHTAGFTLVTVALELVLGLGAALVLHRAFRGRALLRVATLLPWALPTVVAGLLFRFLFDSEAGAVSVVLENVGLERIVWLADPWLAWIPIVLADVWKTAPFVAILLLAGLQQIPGEVYEAAAIDGAGWWTRLVRITVPMLMPAIVVAAAFRALDAFRVFDLVYVLTGGGPGTATEPVALYTFNALFQSLRFGYGSAIAMALFLAASVIGIAAVIAIGRESR